MRHPLGHNLQKIATQVIMIKIHFPTLDQIDEIRKLNQKYLISHLTDKELQGGFIRIEYNTNDFMQIVNSNEIVVATNEDRIVAYYLVGRKSESPALMYQRNKAISLFNSHSIQYERIGYGCQVCIDKSYRNNGISRKMLNLLLTKLISKYDYLLSTISPENIISLQNSRKTGWAVIDEKESPTFYLFKVK